MWRLSRKSSIHPIIRTQPRSLLLDLFDSIEDVEKKRIRGKGKNKNKNKKEETLWKMVFVSDEEY